LNAQSAYIKRIGSGFADKQVLINNLEDFAGFLLQIDLSVRYVDPGQKTKKKKKKKLPFSQSLPHLARTLFQAVSYPRTFLSYFPSLIAFSF